jgi:predicted ATP-dependent protease
VILEDRFEGEVEVIPVANIKDVLKHALMTDLKKDTLFTRLASIFKDGDGIQLGRKGPQTA